MSVTTKERGWPGHFICADRCLFRRNTLIQSGETRIIVSTVGGMKRRDNGIGLEEIGHDRHYETMSWEAKLEATGYWEIDTDKPVDFEANWSLNAAGHGDGIDNVADDMHDAVVAEIVERLSQ